MTKLKMRCLDAVRTGSRAGWVNFGFIKKFWEHFRDDFIGIMNHFHNTGTISKGCSSSFISLIPKKKDPIGFKDYRPINLIGTISKVISKCLANRIKTVIGKVIADTQSAFIKNRFILDSPLMLNEVLSWLNKGKKKAFLLKIDFEKAYDNVNWSFLIDMLDQRGFPPVWCKWVSGILKSARSSVLVNGSPTFEFHYEKGIRQGDPLSPFLFLFIMEALSCMICEASSVGEFKGVRLGGDLVLSHLFYADDALVMGEWSEWNIKIIARILRVFHLCSGLKININKSSLIGVGVTQEEVVDMAAVLGCQVGEYPFTYLGITVGANMNRIVNWRPIYDTLESRLASWKARNLSIGGRVVLLKSVLESLPVYFMSLFKAPCGVINGLEAIMRRFLWAGASNSKKIPWVAWDRVSSPKAEGGLGISKLKDVNDALLAKWIWRYRVEEDNLWKRVIDSCHNGNRGWSFLPSKKNLSGCWNAIVRTEKNRKIGGKSISDFIKGIVGNGTDIRFWLDPWLMDVPLKAQWPQLFSLERDKKCTVADRCNSSPPGGWSWVRQPTSPEEIAEWIDCQNRVASVTFSAAKDRWKWIGNDSGSFSVGSIKTWMNKEYDNSGNFCMKWCKWVPSKCNILMWRAEFDRIPTKAALIKRGVSLESDACPMCNYGSESAEHLFTACEVSYRVWMNITNWFNGDIAWDYDNGVLVYLESEE
ncbi:putative RNA-directed DNA polymerase [Helianthus annuus]|nr:putative RNA-directed DNA polymerase [Helianthus annuus]